LVRVPARVRNGFLHFLKPGPTIFKLVEFFAVDYKDFFYIPALGNNFPIVTPRDLCHKPWQKFRIQGTFRDFLKKSHKL
jgi:hypothetical protein